MGPSKAGFWGVLKGAISRRDGPPMPSSCPITTPLRRNRRRSPGCGRLFHEIASLNPLARLCTRQARQLHPLLHRAVVPARRGSPFRRDGVTVPAQGVAVPAQRGRRSGATGSPFRRDKPNDTSCDPLFNCDFRVNLKIAVGRLESGLWTLFPAGSVHAATVKRLKTKPSERNALFVSMGKISCSHEKDVCPGRDGVSRLTV